MKVRIDDLAQAFVSLLIEHPSKREQLIDAAAASLAHYGLLKQRSAFVRAVAQAWQRTAKSVPAVVATPSGDSGPAKHAIVSALEAFLSAKVELAEQKDATLLGGFALAFGDERLDFSLRSSLHRAAEQLSEAVFH